MTAIRVLTAVTIFVTVADSRAGRWSVTSCVTEIGDRLSATHSMSGLVA